MQSYHWAPSVRPGRVGFVVLADHRVKKKSGKEIEISLDTFLSSVDLRKLVVIEVSAKNPLAGVRNST